MLRQTFSRFAIATLVAFTGSALLGGAVYAKNPSGGGSNIKLPANGNTGVAGNLGKVGQIQTMPKPIQPKPLPNPGNGNLKTGKHLIGYPNPLCTPWIDPCFNHHHCCFDYCYDFCYQPCYNFCYTPVVEVVGGCGEVYLVRVFDGGCWKVYHTCGSYDVAFGHMNTLKAKGLTVAIMKK